MGFRCPICHKDFGLNKNELYKHIQTCNNGLTKIFVNKFLEITNTKELKNEIRKSN